MTVQVEDVDRIVDVLLHRKVELVFRMDHVDPEVVVDGTRNDEVGVLALEALSEFMKDPLDIFLITFCIYIIHIQ